MLTFIGRDQVKLYAKADFLRQQPHGPQWNDSAWLNWWDPKNKVGGVHRLGHEYNRSEGGPPMVAAWSNLITPKGIYRRVEYLPLREADKLSSGWGSGDDTSRVEFDDEGSVWTIEDAEYGVSARLRMWDYHEAFRGFPSAGKTHDEITSDHLDVAGRIAGTITVQGDTFAADGMGVRDHGWGHRNLGTMRSHRYISGTFGPDFSFVSWAIHSVHDTIEIFGWVMKGNTVIFPKDIDVVVYAEIDSCSTRGGRIRYELPGGEVIEAELVAEAPGMQHYFHNLANNNTTCTVYCNGRVGAGMVETSMNYHEGHRAPTKLQRAIATGGFFPALPVNQWNLPGTVFMAKRTL